MEIMNDDDDEIDDELDGMPGGIPELGVVGGRCEVGEAGEL